ncbi:hypothetical protein K2173_002044 [Erythroxylum novogranatense]|uniref:Uncharacterized protein n=1 Tax=Erythroxylum novogranatense TaxID=1862640 RepID=A0AAV8SQ28_9ROSI|nr:hypothetical protein K2173_002044 [Erythroxylum novogranatense]
MFVIALTLNACTILVSVEPKLMIETGNHIMKATLGFFALPNDPEDVVNPLIHNLITLLCAILLTSGEDGRSRAEQLLHIVAVEFAYTTSKQTVLCTTTFPTYHLHLYCQVVKPSVWGERFIVYLPRCADNNSEVRKFSAQILDQLFSISMSLPKPVGFSSSADIELSYRALSSLEDVLAILRSDASIDPSEVFNRIVSSICTLLTKDELVATLHGCAAAICDKIKQAAEGAIQAVIEFVAKRGNELSEADVSRTTQALFCAAVHVTEKHLRLETLGAISSLAESTSSKIVFNEVLVTAGKDIATKDISRIRGGWPMQDVFYAFSQHAVLSFQFLEHLISSGDDILQAAMFALTAFSGLGWSDESPTVRRLCLRGLVQIPAIHISQYTSQILSVIVALLDDLDESVQITSVSCLLMILESSPNDAVEPILLNLCVRLRNLQMSMNPKMRANAFAAFGSLSNYGIGAQREIFLEQIHAVIPRLALHLYDDDLSVRQACRTTLKRVAPLMELEGSVTLFSSHSLASDHRSDYEDFLRDFTRQIVQHLPFRIDTSMASILQVSHFAKIMVFYLCIQGC